MKTLMKIRTKTQRKTLLRVSTLTVFAAALVVMSLPEQGFTKKPRKLPVKSYITGAKIAYGKTTGDEAPRPLDALALLDSCTMWYGMIPEVYFWETLIHSDLAEQTPKTDTIARKERLAKLIGVTDSLAMACDKENKKVKKKYKKKCKPFLITADSVRLGWFTQYYNDAQEYRTQLVDDVMPTIDAESDPEVKAELEAQKDTLLQMVFSDYALASSLAPTDSLGLLVELNLGSLYAELKDYDKSIPYLVKAAERSKESDPGNYLNLLNQVAYSNFQAEHYLEAARVWHQVADEVEGEQKASILTNIIVCFARLQNDDSLYYYNLKILDVDPQNANALAMIGGTWFNRIQELNQENSKAREAKDKSKLAEIKNELDVASDSAIFYLKRAFEADSTDAKSIELYAIANMLKGEKSAATDAWIKLTQLKPNDKTYWVYLGDNYISRQMMKDAIEPYEKAVAIDESDKDVWRSLIDLYKANKMTAKAKKAQAKYDALANK